MAIAIIAITGFQGYWLKNNYEREKQALLLKTNTAFRETITTLQASKLRIDNWNYVFDSTPPRISKINVRRPKENSRIVSGTFTEKPDITVINLLQERLKDSVYKDSTKSIVITYRNNEGPILFDTTISRTQEFRRRRPDSTAILIQEDILGGDENIRAANPTIVRTQTAKDSSENWTVHSPFRQGPVKNQLFRLMYDVDSLFLKDSLTITNIDSAFTKRLKEEKINIPFSVKRIDSTERDLAPEREVTLGFARPITFRLDLGSTTKYYLNKLSLPILFSLFLVGISVLSFVLLYRGMMKQQRLVELKNDFISNISHELKTPIATMGVAIEALKNFNVLNDTRKTQEYLDISENELQRLNLLVDKVLKLSMFGRKEMDLKFEKINLGDIVTEVYNSMKLQIEKVNANVNIQMTGDLEMMGDRIHLLSVVFNLLDNALRYRVKDPVISLILTGREDHVEFKIEDNGIGIPAEYQKKIFEKFFRVPSGNTHNAKGHGLGLSYVSAVVRKHKGTISVSSQLDKGTSFTISLPKHQS
jgi:two-component system phosphate regulon sensor histidine kinase PhoR